MALGRYCFGPESAVYQIGPKLSLIRELAYLQA